MRKVAYIIIVALLVLVTGLVWYFLSNNSKDPQEINPATGLPFGSGDDLNLPAGSGLTTAPNDNLFFDAAGTPVAKLFYISNAPVSGFTTFARGTQSVVRYVDRATGHIYDAALPSGTSTSFVRTKITNNTRPKIYQAIFASDGSKVLMRSLKDDTDIIENLVLTLTLPKATSTDGLYSVSAVALRGDVGEVAATGPNSLIYTLNDTPSVVTSGFDGGGVKTLLTTPFLNWRFSKLGSNFLATTKAHSFAPGFAYTLTQSGLLNKIVGPLSGLTAVANSAGTRLAYSYVEGGKTVLWSMNLTSGTPSELNPPTLADKCAWSAKYVDVVYCGVPINGIYPNEPESWYKGVSHYSDRIWRMESNSGIVDVVVEPKKQFEVDIDAASLQVTPNEDYLIFTNQNDLSLWAVKLDPVLPRSSFEGD